MLTKPSITTTLPDKPNNISYQVNGRRLPHNGILCLLIVGMLSLTACSDNNSSNDAANNSADKSTHADADATTPDTNTDDHRGPNLAQNTPAIHLEQTAMLLVEGKPMVEFMYKQMADNCKQVKKQMPDLVFTPLAPEQVKKLGRVNFHVWYQGTKMSVQRESWGYQFPPTDTNNKQIFKCAFEPTHRSQRWLRGPDMDNAIYRSSEGANAHIVYTAAQRTSYASQAETAEDKKDKDEADTKEFLHQSGVDELPPQKIEGPQQVAGQPCTVQVKLGAYKICTWAQSGKWGFNGDGAIIKDDITLNRGSKDYDDDNYVKSPYTNTIHLWEKPATAGDTITGASLNTELMTVGEPIDQQVFELPPEVSSGQLKRLKK